MSFYNTWRDADAARQDGEVVTACYGGYLVLHWTELLAMGLCSSDILTEEVILHEI